MRSLAARLLRGLPFNRLMTIMWLFVLLFTVVSAPRASGRPNQDDVFRIARIDAGRGPTYYGPDATEFDNLSVTPNATAEGATLEFEYRVPERDECTFSGSFELSFDDDLTEWDAFSRDEADRFHSELVGSRTTGGCFHDGRHRASANAYFKGSNGTWGDRIPPLFGEPEERWNNRTRGNTGWVATTRAPEDIDTGVSQHRYVGEQDVERIFFFMRLRVGVTSTGIPGTDWHEYDVLWELQRGLSPPIEPQVYLDPVHGFWEVDGDRRTSGEAVRVDEGATIGGEPGARAELSVRCGELERRIVKLDALAHLLAGAFERQESDQDELVVSMGKVALAWTAALEEHGRICDREADAVHRDSASVGVAQAPGDPVIVLELERGGVRFDHTGSDIPFRVRSPHAVIDPVPSSVFTVAIDPRPGADGTLVRTRIGTVSVRHTQDGPEVQVPAGNQVSVDDDRVSSPEPIPAPPAAVYLPAALRAGGFDRAPSGTPGAEGTREPTVQPVPTMEPDPTPTPDHGGLEVEAILALNQVRTSRGLEPVYPHSALTNAARRHSRDMAENAHLSHIGTDGSTPESRADDANYPGDEVQESIARGFRDAEELIEALLDSPEDRDHMLRDDMVDLGVGVSGDDELYWTIVYGTG